MNDLKQVVFWIGCLMVIWLIVSDISLGKILLGLVNGAGKGAETTIDAWVNAKQGNKFNPRP